MELTKHENIGTVASSKLYSAFPFTLLIDCVGVVGHFVSSPREREKRDRRDEREEQGRKRNRNEREETEEIKTFPLYLYLLQP